MMKVNILNKNLMVFMLALALLGLTGCKLATPEIRGVVIDEATGEPVPNAWITGGIMVETSVGRQSYISFVPPHTRTDRDGRFVVPPQNFDKSTSLSGFGKSVKSIGVGASVVDDRGGSVSLKEFFGRNVVDVAIYVKPEHDDDTEGEYFIYLQGLKKYCDTGRFSVERSVVKGGCDSWELDYVITKHEKYLDKYKNPKIIEDPPYGVGKYQKIVHYSATLERLAKLYKRKGDYKKALELFKKVKDFDAKNDLSTKEHEKEIKELEGLLKE
jgi:hypothetical protein